MQKSIKMRKQEEEEVLCFYIMSTEWLKGIAKLKKMDKKGLRKLNKWKN